MASLTPDNLTADKLIAAHDGDVALLYIWLCRNGEFNADKAACDLCKTEREIEAAFEKLSRLEFYKAPEKKPVIKPEETLPEYTARDIVKRVENGDGFKAVIDEAQRIYGRLLSSADMKTLFGIYDHLGFSPELLCLMLNYCAELTAAKFGSGRLPTMRSIEKEAYNWANLEILTLEQAEEYIAKAAERRSAMGEIKEALGIRGRELSKTESRYVNEWLDMGFGAEVLSVAYDRTVTNTGGLKWNYMDKILRSWQEKGIYSLDDIAEKDSRRPTAKGDSGEVDLDYLKAVYEKVKKNNG